MTLPIRIARPVSALERSAAMYREALGFRELGRFENHAGFDGIILGLPHENWHLEFTYCPGHPIAPATTAEDLLVFYMPDAAEWQHRCAAVLTAGFVEVEAFNPYWRTNGRTFADLDGYRVVFQRAPWNPA